VLPGYEVLDSGPVIVPKVRPSRYHNKLFIYSINLTCSPLFVVGGKIFVEAGVSLLFVLINRRPQISLIPSRCKPPVDALGFSGLLPSRRYFNEAMVRK
jgi:hypothetical protein